MEVLKKIVVKCRKRIKICETGLSEIEDLVLVLGNILNENLMWSQKKEKNHL